MSAYKIPADSVDECIKIGKDTTIQSLKKFCRRVTELDYLRQK